MTAAAGTAVVLVVDDEPLVRLCTAKVLSEAGFEVIDAHSADHALDALQRAEEPIAAVITDLDMPSRANGCALAWRVRTLFPDAAIILVSGVAAPDPLTLPPTTLFIKKPLSLQTFVHEVRAVIAVRVRGSGQEPS